MTVPSFDCFRAFALAADDGINEGRQPGRHQHLQRRRLISTGSPTDAANRPPQAPAAFTTIPVVISKSGATTPAPPSFSMAVTGQVSRSVTPADETARRKARTQRSGSAKPSSSTISAPRHPTARLGSRRSVPSSRSGAHDRSQAPAAWPGGSPALRDRHRPRRRGSAPPRRSRHRHRSVPEGDATAPARRAPGNLGRVPVQAAHPAGIGGRTPAVCGFQQGDSESRLGRRQSTRKPDQPSADDDQIGPFGPSPGRLRLEVVAEENRLQRRTNAQRPDLVGRRPGHRCDQPHQTWPAHSALAGPHGTAGGRLDPVWPGSALFDRRPDRSNRHAFATADRRLFGEMAVHQQRRVDAIEETARAQCSRPTGTQRCRRRNARRRAAVQALQRRSPQACRAQSCQIGALDAPGIAGDPDPVVGTPAIGIDDRLEALPVFVPPVLKPQ